MGAAGHGYDRFKQVRVWAGQSCLAGIDGASELAPQILTLAVAAAAAACAARLLGGPAGW